MPAFNVAVALNVVAPPLDEGLEVFWLTNGGSLGHIFQTTRNDGWSAPSLFGGAPSMTYIGVGQNTTGRLELFGCTSHGSLYHVWQTSPGDSTSWTPNWMPMGSGTNVLQPVLSRHFALPAGSLPFDGVDVSGQLEVFANNKSYMAQGWALQIMQMGAGGNWSGWNNIGDNDGVPWTVAQNVDGTLEVFTINNQNDVQFTRQAQPPPNSGFGAWQLFAGEYASLVQIEVALNGDPGGIPGRLELFGVSDSGDVWHTWQQSPGDDSSWMLNWQILGNTPAGGIKQITVGQNSDGRLEVFGVDNGNRPWHQWQNLASQGGGWSNWQPLGWDLNNPSSAPTVGDIVVGHNGDGRLEVFSRNGDDTGQHTWQDPNGAFGGWAGWVPLW